MKSDRAPKIMSVDKVSEGLIITFADGSFALFPTAFLHSALPRVRELVEVAESEPLLGSCWAAAV